jgi:hypothetical protein
MDKKVRTPKSSLDKEKITNYDTMTHINHVRRFMNKFVKDLLDRSEKHDNSKMEEPELPIFMEFTPRLGTVEYNSNEYKKFLEDMKPALDHHYANNSHHPEHFKNGIDDMSLIDLLELLADWKGSTLRNKNGNIRKSLEINKERFKISDQLYNILNNTINFIEKE